MGFVHVRAIQNVTLVAVMGLAHLLHRVENLGGSRSVEDQQ